MSYGTVNFFGIQVWLRRVQNLLKQNIEGIQSVINRALLCLPRHKHIKFISQTAILEFKCGVPDRGRSLFEGMLREYPKRTDLWSIYLDQVIICSSQFNKLVVCTCMCMPCYLTWICCNEQEIRLDDEDVIRALFERAISLSLPPKKMKVEFSLGPYSCIPNAILLQSLLLLLLGFLFEGLKFVTFLTAVFV